MSSTKSCHTRPNIRSMQIITKRITKVRWRKFWGTHRLTKNCLFLVRIIHEQVYTVDIGAIRERHDFRDGLFKYGGISKINLIKKT